jgi:hypothetical protein
MECWEGNEGILWVLFNEDNQAEAQGFIPVSPKYLGFLALIRRLLHL